MVARKKKKTINENAAEIIKHVYKVSRGDVPPDVVAGLKETIMGPLFAKREPHPFLFGIFKETCTVMASQGPAHAARIADMKERLKQCAGEWPEAVRQEL